MSRPDAPRLPLRRTVVRPARAPGDPTVLPPPGDAAAGAGELDRDDDADRADADRDDTDRDGTVGIDAQPSGYEAV